MNSSKKILVIQTAFIGDLIMSTGIFPALKELFPMSEIDVVTIPASAIILKHNPYINQVYTFDKKTTFINKIKSFISLVFKLRKNKYVIGISIQHYLTSSFLMLFSNIKFKVGRQSMKFVDINVSISSGLHNKEKSLALLNAFSDKDFTYNSEIFITEDLIESAKQRLIKNSKKNICIAPGSVWETKKLPAKKYVEIINKLNDYNVYLIGAKNEFDLCNSILDKTTNQNVVNLAGALNLLESSALIKLSDLLLSNDSAPLHIANAVETPVFAFFGPTVKKFGCYPYREKDQIIEIDLDCRPCSKHGTNVCPLGHHNCMNLIDTNDVFMRITKLLRN